MSSGGLQNVKSLYLGLSRNNIGSGGITPLAERLSTLKLTSLDLSHNSIGPDDATTLAGGIKGLTELEELDLSHNNIGPDGAAALADGIKGLTELRQLNLSRNNIGPDGAAVLAGGLQYLTELSRCNLSHNNIDVAAAKAVLNSLKKCNHRCTLIINESDIYQFFDTCIMILGLVSPDDTTTISELVDAAQHENKTRTLALDLETIKVPPRTQVPTVVKESPVTEVSLPSKSKCVFM